MEQSKEVAESFIDQRPHDRIGIVAYEGEAFTQVPVTTDHVVVKNGIKGLKTGMLEGGTAIGMGLATAVNRLRQSEAKSKVIIPRPGMHSTPQPKLEIEYASRGPASQRSAEGSAPVCGHGTAADVLSFNEYPGW